MLPKDKIDKTIHLTSFRKLRSNRWSDAAQLKAMNLNRVCPPKSKDVHLPCTSKSNPPSTIYPNSSSNPANSHQTNSEVWLPISIVEHLANHCLWVRMVITVRGRKQITKGSSIRVLTQCWPDKSCTIVLMLTHVSSILSCATLSQELASLKCRTKPDTTTLKCFRILPNLTRQISDKPLVKKLPMTSTISRKRKTKSTKNSSSCNREWSKSWQPKTSDTWR